MNKKVFLSIIFFLVLVSFISAVPPFQSSETLEELVVIYPKNEFFSLGQNFKLHFHVLNSSGYELVATQSNCFIHVYGMTNNHLIESLLVNDGNGVDKFIQVNTSIITDLGVYPYLVACNSTQGEAGFVSGVFEVTKNGFSSNQNNGLWIQVFMFLTIGFLVLVGLRFLSNDNDNNDLKFFLQLTGVLFFFLAFLLLTILSYISFEMSSYESFKGVLRAVFVVFAILFGLISTVGTLVLSLVASYQGFKLLFKGFTKKK